jgi:hypothetical protein
VRAGYAVLDYFKAIGVHGGRSRCSTSFSIWNDFEADWHVFRLWSDVFSSDVTLLRIFQGASERNHRVG